MVEGSGASTTLIRFPLSRILCFAHNLVIQLPLYKTFMSAKQRTARSVRRGWRGGNQHKFRRTCLQVYKGNHPTITSSIKKSCSSRKKKHFFLLATPFLVTWRSIAKSLPFLSRTNSGTWLLAENCTKKTANKPHHAYPGFDRRHLVVKGHVRRHSLVGHRHSQLGFRGQVYDLSAGFRPLLLELADLHKIQYANRCQGVRESERGRDGRTTPPCPRSSFQVDLRPRGKYSI